jgi:hypothetical protein
MNTSEIWQTVLGVIGLLGVLAALARISFQLGALVTEFRLYRVTNDKIVADVAERVKRLERKGRWGSGVT